MVRVRLRAAIEIFFRAEPSQNELLMMRIHSHDE